MGSRWPSGAGCGKEEHPKSKHQPPEKLPISNRHRASQLLWTLEAGSFSGAWRLMSGVFMSVYLTKEVHVIDWFFERSLALGCPFSDRFRPFPTVSDRFRPFPTFSHTFRDAPLVEHGFPRPVTESESGDVSPQSTGADGHDCWRVMDLFIFIRGLEPEDGKNIQNPSSNIQRSSKIQRPNSLLQTPLLPAPCSLLQRWDMDWPRGCLKIGTKSVCFGGKAWSAERGAESWKLGKGKLGTNAKAHRSGRRKSDDG